MPLSNSLTKDMLPLPIDSLLPEIVASLGRAPQLVIEAPPGAGKTTRVPPALLDANTGEGEVWVLEPRRLAARLAATRVAEERGETVGETVGYQVRFDEASSARTRLRFLTEGVFTRRLLSNPQLKGVGVVILDEFHERHLQADLALALLRRLQRTTRTDLRVVVMSATLDAAPIARYLGDCPVLRSEGRRFEVSIEHLARPDDRPLEEQVAASIRQLVNRRQLDGDVLVFLPGAAEIRRAQKLCLPLAGEANMLCLPLHGELPATEQDRAVRPAGQRKIILSTNVAESSITIEGVAAVVDSGLARMAGHSHWSGLPTLKTGRISRASAEQRAGRAGRVRAGLCVRLYTAQEFAARPAYDMPEIARLDLSETLLELHGAGIGDLSDFEWFEPPQSEALEAAEVLLRRLDAVDARGELTEVGRRMLRLPLHPRLSRLVVEAERRGVGQEGCLWAALIGERDIRTSGLALQNEAPRRSERRSHSPSDLFELAELFEQAERARFSHEALRERQLDGGALRRVERVRRQLSRLLEAGKRPVEKHEQKSLRAEIEKSAKTAGQSGKTIEQKGKAEGKREKDEERREKTDDQREKTVEQREAELLISVLAGYPDRVARRRATPNAQREERAVLLLSNGSSALLSPESVVRQAEFVVAVEAEERREAGAGRSAGMRGARTLVRLASGIEPEWLLELFPEAIRVTKEVEWNEEAARVEVRERLVYDELVLDESRADAAHDAEASRLLADKALSLPLSSFIENEGTWRFLARLSFLRRAWPEGELPLLGEEELRQALGHLCEGRRSFAELREAVRAGLLLDALRRRLSTEQLRQLEKMTPEKVALKGGRQVRVNYEADKAPWIASRLQDFFGMKEAPKVAGGRVALVLHLLAPSQRPLQVTADLAGFWQRHYPSVRRELGRRYPRHAWPEDPLNPDAKGSK